MTYKAEIHVCVVCRGKEDRAEYLHFRKSLMLPFVPQIGMHIDLRSELNVSLLDVVEVLFSYWVCRDSTFFIESRLRKECYRTSEQARDSYLSRGWSLYPDPLRGDQESS